MCLNQISTFKSFKDIYFISLNSLVIVYYEKKFAVKFALNEYQSNHENTPWRTNLLECICVYMWLKNNTGIVSLFHNSNSNLGIDCTNFIRIDRNRTFISTLYDKSIIRFFTISVSEIFSEIWQPQNSR